MWIIRYLGFLLCGLLGHKVENHLSEEEDCFLTKRCKRCKVGVGLPHWKPKKDFPPPNSTTEQLVEWEKFCDSYVDNFKNERV